MVLYCISCIAKCPVLYLIGTVTVLKLSVLMQWPKIMFIFNSQHLLSEMLCSNETHLKARWAAEKISLKLIGGWGKKTLKPGQKVLWQNPVSFKWWERICKLLNLLHGSSSNLVAEIGYWDFYFLPWPTWWWLCMSQAPGWPCSRFSDVAGKLLPQFVCLLGVLYVWVFFSPHGGNVDFAN